MVNPFRAKAERARALYERLAGHRTAHDRGMAEAFPLGAGYGRKGGERRIEASVNRAVKTVEAFNRCRHLEAQADAFDAGKINAQGRRISPESIARSEKRAVYQEGKAARIAAAKSAIEGKHPSEVDAETWATAHGYLGGRPRELVVSEHRERYHVA